MSRINVPNAQLSAPALGNLPSTVPPVARVTTGSALGAGLEELGETLSDIGELERQARRARQFGEYTNDIMQKVNDAELQAEQVDPAETLPFFDTQMEAVEEQIDDIDDEVLRASVSERYGALKVYAASRLKRYARHEEARRMRAAHDQTAEMMLLPISRGEISAREAIIGFEAQVDLGVGTAYNAESAEDRKADFALAAVREQYAYLWEHNPAAAADFIADDKYAKLHMPQPERMRRVEEAKAQHEIALARDAEQMLQNAKNVLHREMNQEAFAVTAEGIHQAIGEMVTAINEHPGAKVKGAFGSERGITREELVVALVNDELMNTVYSNELGRELKAEALMKALPDNAAADELRNRAKAVLARTATDADKQKAAIKYLTGRYSQGIPTADIPRDQGTLNAFWKEQKRRRANPADVAHWLVVNKSDLPGDMLKDLNRDFNWQTLNLERGVEVLRAITDAGNENMARRVASGSDNSTLAEVAYHKTIGLDPRSPEHQEVLGVLSKANPALISTAHKALTGTKADKSDRLDYVGYLKKADIKPDTPSATLIRDWKNEFFYAFTEQATVYNNDDPKDQAATDAASRVAHQYFEVRASGDDWMVPADLGVGSIAQPFEHAQELLKDAFSEWQDQLNENYGFFGTKPTIRPDLRVRLGREAFIPAIIHGEITGWMAWNVTGHTFNTFTPDSDAFLHETLTGLMNNRIERSELRLDANLRYSEQYGVRSVQEFDQQFFPGGGGIRDRIINYQHWRWVEEYHVEPDMNDPDFWRRVDLHRKELGWPGWSIETGERRDAEHR